MAHTEPGMPTNGPTPSGQGAEQTEIARLRAMIEEGLAHGTDFSNTSRTSEDITKDINEATAAQRALLEDAQVAAANLQKNLAEAQGAATDIARGVAAPFENRSLGELNDREEREAA